MKSVRRFHITNRTKNSTINMKFKGRTMKPPKCRAQNTSSTPSTVIISICLWKSCLPTRWFINYTLCSLINISGKTKTLCKRENGAYQLVCVCANSLTHFLAWQKTITSKWTGSIMDYFGKLRSIRDSLWLTEVHSVTCSFLQL